MSSFNLERLAETDIARGGTDHDGVDATFNFPLLGLDVEVTEGHIIKRDLNSDFLTFLDEDFLVSFELFYRAEDLSVDHRDIELCDFFSIVIASVFDGEGDTFLIHFIIRVGEGGVRKTVTERIFDRDRKYSS